MFSCSALPMTSPLTADTSVHRSNSDHASLIAIIDAAVIFAPDALRAIEAVKR